MGVEKRGENTPYYYRFMVDGKKYRGVCTNCYRKRDAEAFEKNKRAEIARIREIKSTEELYEAQRRRLTGNNGISLADAFEESLKKPHSRSISDKKLKQKRGVWNDFVAFMEAKHPEVDNIAAISISHAEEYIALIRASGRFQKDISYRRGNRTISTKADTGKPSAATSKLYQTVCAEVLTLLANDAGITKNPFAAIKKPANDEAPRDIFTPDEVRLILDSADNFTRPLFTVGFMTALREGDICTLRWREIDFQSKLINRLMNKTNLSVVIPIASSLLSYFNEQYALTGSGEYVFPGLERMYRENQTGVSYRVKQFLKKLGIKTTRKPKGRAREVSVKDLHSCRHTFCYIAGMKRIPLSIVQSIVGHMTPEMTRHYSAHATIEDKKRWMEVMPDFISPPQITQTVQTGLLEEDTERTELLQKLEALPTEKLRRLVEFAASMDTKALPRASAADRGDSAKSGNHSEVCGQP